MIRRQNSALLAWIFCGVVIILLLVEAGVNYNAVGATKTIPAAINLFTSTLVYILSAIVGALIVSHQPRNRIGWLLIFISAAIAIVGQTALFLPKPGDDLSQVSLITLLSAWIQSWGWWLLMGPIFLIPVLFPTGKLLSPRWRWLVAAILADFSVFLFIATFAVKIQIGETGMELVNPIGFLSKETINRIVSVFIFGILATAAFCVAAVFIRYRRAAAVEREQIKWLLYAYAIFLVDYTIGAIVQSSDWGGIIFNLILLCIPAAIGISILRYRLWDIDILIRRTLVYAAVSAVLGLVYFGSVVLLQQIFRAISGESSPAAVVLSTLAIIVIFAPLRRQVQVFVDRRFYRSRYDAEKVLQRFVDQARVQADLEQLAAQLVGTVKDSVEPATISMWLAESKSPRSNSAQPKVKE